MLSTDKEWAERQLVKLREQLIFKEALIDQLVKKVACLRICLVEWCGETYMRGKEEQWAKEKP